MDTLATWRREPVLLPSPAAISALYAPSLGFDPLWRVDQGKWERYFNLALYRTFASIDGGPEFDGLSISASTAFHGPLMLGIPKMHRKRMRRKREVSIHLRAEHPHPECPDHEADATGILAPSREGLLITKFGDWRRVATATPQQT